MPITKFRHVKKFEACLTPPILLLCQHQSCMHASCALRMRGQEAYDSKIDALLSKLPDPVQEMLIEEDESIDNRASTPSSNHNLPGADDEEG